MKIFKGCCTALVTPFTDDKRVDFDCLEKLLDFQIKSRIDGILVCGTTGEASTLSDKEHISVLQFCKEKIGGRVPFIAGTGSNNTLHAIFMSQQAEKIGADALLIVTPYYNKCSEEGLFLHYQAIASQTSLPIILYNVPGRTAVDIKPNMVKRLSQIENIKGIKEASGNVKRIDEIRSLCKEDFAIYSGNDDITLDVMEKGGDGVISVVSNILPQKCSEMTSCFAQGKREQAYKIFESLKNITELLFKDVNPIAVKACLGLMGMLKTNYRLPLCLPDERLMESLKCELERLEVI